MRHRHDPQRHPLAGNLVACLPALPAAAAARFLLPIGDEPAAAALTAALYACATLLLLPLLLVNRRGPANGWMASTLMAAVVMASLLLLDPLTRSLGGLLPALLLTMLLAAANVALLARIVPAALLCVLLLTATLAPVWAAPLVELAGNPGWLSRLVVSASPLTAFSVPLELDYLRTSWFYANSALGSMRYVYPDLLSIRLGLSVLPAAAIVARLLAGTTVTPLRLPREAHP